MAAAVGAALTQSPLVALCIFAALGVGLALPYLLLSFAPWMRRALPKPGAWMDTLKQVFAFPMYASAAWLLWVLAQQTSSIGLGAALAGAIPSGWRPGLPEIEGQLARGRVVALNAVAAVLLAIVLPARFAGVAAASPSRRRHAAAADGGSLTMPPGAQVCARAAAPGQLHRELVPDLPGERAQCLHGPGTAHLPQQRRHLMKGDWTNSDPRSPRRWPIRARRSASLRRLQRQARLDRTLVLPQLLTAGIVQTAFAGLPDRDSR